MGVKVAFLPEYPLVLFLLKYRGVGAFLNEKMKNPNRGSPTLELPELFSRWNWRLPFQFAYWYEIFQSQGDSIENIGQKIIISHDDNCGKIYIDLPLVLSSGGFVLHQCMKSHLF